MFLALMLVLAAPTPEAAARQFIDDVRAGHAAGVSAVLDARMRAAITPAQLTATWNQTVAPLGLLQRFEAPTRFTKDALEGVVFRIQFERGVLQVTTAWDPALGQVAGFFLKPLTEPTAPDAGPVDPASLATFDVKVGHAPFELPGTLTVPNGGGRHPAVVLVQGSGPSDRDETIGPNKPFLDLALGLSSKGIVVLRYDKRTRVHRQAYAGKDITLDEEVVDDAVAALELLKARDDVDPARLFVVGHSLGALLAPSIALKAQGVAGVVLLAPPSRKPWDILSQQLRYVGAPAAKVAEVDRAFAGLRAGRSTPVLNAPASYWKAWAAVDGPAQARRFAGRVLVLHGARDYQVIDQDLAGWKKGLAGLKSSTFLEFPGLNHLFMRGEGPSMPAEYETPGHVAPEVIEAIVGFCLAAAQ